MNLDWASSCKVWSLGCSRVSSPGCCLELAGLGRCCLAGEGELAGGRWGATGSSSLTGGGEEREVASTADTLACRLVSCSDILLISGMSSWAEQQGWGAGGFGGASARGVEAAAVEGRCREARRRVTSDSRSRTLWPRMADLSCSAFREDSVVASFSLMDIMTRSDSSCSSLTAVRAGAAGSGCLRALERGGAGGRGCGGGGGPSKA